ncbi:MAG: hypothetical protein ACI97N_002423, partial [Cognaticolwellia sp.]
SKRQYLNLGVAFSVVGYLILQRVAHLYYIKAVTLL